MEPGNAIAVAEGEKSLLNAASCATHDRASIESMPETSDSAFSSESFLRPASASEQGGIVEALARSHLNPFGPCSKGAPAAKVDITRDFPDRHFADRHWAAAGDIVEHARAAVARERLPASSTGDHWHRPFRTQAARAALAARGFLNPGTNPVSALVVATATTIRAGARKLPRWLATARSSISSHGLPAIACWVGAGFFVRRATADITCPGWQ